MKKLFNIAITSALIIGMGAFIMLLIPVACVMGIFDIIKDEYKDEEERKNRGQDDWPDVSGRNR